MLDLARLRLALVAEGEAGLRRLAALDAAGAHSLAVFAPEAGTALAAAAGERLARRLPEDSELAAVQLVFIAGLAPELRDRIAARARACGAIVHAEDAPASSDAAATSVLRRGDLTIAVSTAGKSPALAVEIRKLVGRVIGPDWSARLEQAALHRRQWRAAGLAPAEVARRTGAWLAQSAGRNG